MSKFNFNAKLFSDSTKIKAILLESLAEGDEETFRDVLLAFLRSQSLSSFSKKVGVGRQTIYDMFNKPKTFDLQISTLTKLFAVM